MTPTFEVIQMMVGNKLQIFRKKVGIKWIAAPGRLLTELQLGTLSKLLAVFTYKYTNLNRNHIRYSIPLDWRGSLRGHRLPRPVRCGPPWWRAVEIGRTE